jgi:phage gp45-like
MNERMMAIRAPDGSRSGLVVVAEVGGSYRARALVQVESALYDGRCREEEVRVDRG